MLDPMPSHDEAPAPTAGPELAAGEIGRAATGRVAAGSGRLGRFGLVLGLGLSAYGTCRAAGDLTAAIAAAAARPAELMAAGLDALATVLAWGIAGGAAALACRLAEAAWTARAERSARRDERVIGLAERAIAALERLAATRADRPADGGGHPVNPPEPDPRARLLTEIAEAERSGRFDAAAALLDELADRFPGDPAIAAIRPRIEAGRAAEAEGHLARIEAARRVNDPASVLELYRTVAAWLEAERRGELERELAAWFRELIFRRLRAGRIQPDVVDLATQVAETFAATVEGASLRASLPTLRRSVGLCPRCAQPYTGAAAACPRCLAGPQPPPAAEAVEPDEPLDPE